MSDGQAGYDRICVTFDVDWAEDQMVLSVVERMQQAGVRATFFATHASPLLAGIDAEQFEVGLHPNFEGTDGDFRGPIESLKALYPHAKGARSHGLFVSSRILQLCMEYGIEYEANNFLLFHEGLHPVLRFQDLVSIPFYWSDDKHLSLCDTFDLDDLRLDVAGLKVLNFHPVHVYMNTFSEANYQSFKPHLRDARRYNELVNDQRAGVGTLFQSLLEHLSRGNQHTWLLREICEEYRGADG